MSGCHDATSGHARSSRIGCSNASIHPHRTDRIDPRRSRLFRALQEVKAWIPVDGYYDMGPGPRQSQADQEQAYPLSECMSCGCCLEACPQYLKVEVERLEGETDEQYKARRDAEHDKHFIRADDGL